MNEIDYLNSVLKLKGYKSIEDYIDKRSNEILFDEVWLWRTKVGIEEDFPKLSHNEVIRILSQIMKQIIEKGGVMVDYSHEEAEKIIRKFDDTKKYELIDEISNFILQNPDYGSDGNGIWFEYKSQA
ncbi:hypothetical protein EGK75_13810 [Neisseria weixii]|uniref:Uncharacterized protein n=1 Tax=Neisseria weixii TaxID=1853276 RepID=A0A3N4MUZ3_9NEIS|nr:hypothetical protein [Neisseria weixii]RPD82999.1 hypothetical protein EGK74_13860 [Neisseria weixii]RPD83135.1 hypothetical protein EGK75_13810 [Neisseria weixii]